jgi:molybdopterin-guanine dinucleotide biosynthesis protein A
VPDVDPGCRGPADDLAAIVLAGGRAARLGGADKPGLVVGTRTLLAAVVSAAAEAGAGQVVVVGPARPGIAGPGPVSPGPVSPGPVSPGPVGSGPVGSGPVGSGPVGSGRVEFVREDPPGTGPVAALRCGLGRVGAPWVAVLAADMPFLRARHLVALLAAAGRPEPGPGQPASPDRAGPPGRGAILVDETGRPQWLAGCWPTAALRGRLDGYPGDSLHGLLDPLRPVRLSYPPGPGDPPPWLDCDTAGDLSRARDWARRSR